MKLGTRVALAVTAVTATALLASFIAVALLVSRDETHDMDHALLMQAHASAERALLRDPRQPKVSDGLAAVPEALAAIPRYIAIYDQNGVPTSFSQNFKGKPPSIAELGPQLPISGGGEAVDLTVAGVGLRGVVIPVGGEAGHLLLFAAARSSIDQDLSFLRRAASTIFISAMILTSLVARWLSSRISRDVEAVATVARAVAEGNLDARIGPAAQGTTETRALAADMDRMIHQLQALVIAQRTFVSHAAHELRSPLATIRGELQLSLRRERTPEEYRQAIEAVLADVQAMSALSEDLLVLAHVQTAHEGIRALDTISPADLLAETLKMVRGVANERQVSVDVAFESEGAAELPIQGPSAELSRALRNLVDNAISHTPHGGRVCIQLRKEADLVVLRVVDRGPGILNEDREHIFQPFFRGSRDQGSDRPGAGLGLAIAREIARKRRGDVTLSDASHESGSVFELSLPIVGPPGSS